MGLQIEGPQSGPMMVGKKIRSKESFSKRAKERKEIKHKRII